MAKTVKTRTTKKKTVTTAAKPERNWVEALRVANRKGVTKGERIATLSPTQRDAMIAELRELSASATADDSLMPDADLAAKAMQRQREMAEAAAELVQSEDSAVGQLTAGVLRLCASAFPKAIGAKLVIEKNDSDTVELHLPVCRSVIAATDTHGPQPTSTPEAEQKVRYRRMVAAVREWLAVEHPQPLADRVDICLYGDSGGGDSVAWFHADAEDPYVQGDLMAAEPAG